MGGEACEEAHWDTRTFHHSFAVRFTFAVLHLSTGGTPGHPVASAHIFILLYYFEGFTTAERIRTQETGHLVEAAARSNCLFLMSTLCSTGPIHLITVS